MRMLFMKWCRIDFWMYSFLVRKCVSDNDMVQIWCPGARSFMQKRKIVCPRVRKR